VTNNTKYTLGIKSIGGSSIIEGDGMFGLVLSNNDTSRLIKIDQRFIVNGQAWKATQTDRVTTKGVLAVLLGETAINYETDDMVLGIADYKTVIPHTYTYNIPTTFELTNGTSANLVYSIKDETGQDIDYSGVAVTSSSALINITNTNGVISISGVDIGTNSMKLSVTLGGVLKEFDIAFEVKTDVIAPIISYSTNFSQSITALKTYMTNVLSVSKLSNGVIDNSLQINYSFDANTQTLILQNKIIVTAKSPSSISIKNTSITSPTDIYLTVSDSSNGIKILDTQKITLVGM